MLLRGASLGIAFAVAYLLLGETVMNDGYRHLGLALLNGRLWIPDRPEVVVIGPDMAYLPLPPVPAFLYIPLQAVGLMPTTTVVSALVGGVGVFLTYVFTRNAWIAGGIGASTLGWAAATGGDWLTAQVVGYAFAVASLLVARTGRWPVAAGLLLGLAAGSRLPLAFLFPLLLYFYRASRWNAWAQVALGALAVAMPIAIYNVARFGSPLDFGYAHIKSHFHPGETVLAESWFSEGIISISYIPRSIASMLFAGVEVVPTFPWMRVPVAGLSIAFTAPILLLAVRASLTRLALVAWGTALLIMLPNWMHGSWGFWQLGYRFIIDAMPALLVPIGLAYRDRKADAWLIGATLLGGAATLYWFTGQTTGGLPFPY